MTWNLARTLCLLLLIAVTIQAQDEDVVIRGRVVDSTRQPVKDADVSLFGLESENSNKSRDQRILLNRTSEDGTFVFHLPSVSQEKALLHVSTAVPPGVYAPLRPPFDNVSGASLFPGKLITIGKEREINVGDIGVEVHFKSYRVLVGGNTSEIRKYLNSGDASLCLRLRDARGDLVASGTVPPRIFRNDESSFELALPDGAWSSEVRFCGSNGPWYSVSRVAGGRESDANQFLTVMIGAERVDAISADQIPAYSINEARQRLSELHIPYNRESFIKHAGKCNTQAVQLFLAAGMNPNATDKGRSTALIAAAARECSEVVKILLNANANPNAVNDANTSPLLAAAASGNLSAVNALLKKKATPNVIDHEGLTPLIIASANGHLPVVKALLAAGAEINIKDKRGMSALDYAVQTGNEEVLRALKLAVSRVTN